MNSLQQLIAVISPLQRKIWQIYILAMLQGLFYLSVPLGVQGIITYTMAGEMSASLFLLCFLTVLSVVFLGIFQLWQTRINDHLQQQILVNFGVRFSEKIAKLKLVNTTREEISSKINYFFEVTTFQKGLTKILLDFSLSMFTILLGLILLSLYSVLFAVFAASTAMIFYFLIRSYGKKGMESSLQESKKKYAFVDWLHQLNDTRSEDLEVNQDNAQQKILEKSSSKLSAFVQESNVNHRILDFQYRAILMFKVIFTACILFFGIWMVQNGTLNIGQFLASEIILILILNAVEKVITNLKTVYDLLTATQKINQVLDLEENEQLSKKIDYSNLVSDLKNAIVLYKFSRAKKRVMYALIILTVIIFCMPWNQTVHTSGKVSTLNPGDRPQKIPSRIAGRIEKWFVSEGQFIKKNDTLAFISEVKDDYFDPKLVERTQDQVKAKESSILSYQNKENAINSQIDALNQGLSLKLDQTRIKIKQTRNKIYSDSVEFVSADNNNTIAEQQLARYEELLTKKVISKTDFENRKAKGQESYAKKIVAQNKWINAKNELMNLNIELNSAKQEYNEKIMKSESDKYSVLSTMYDTEATLSKMQNQLTNYTIRNSFYYVLAPQDGFVIKSFVNGVGDIVKEGSPLLEFSPNLADLSIEMYIEPMDLPLVHKNMNIQVQFDGWPAFVFSGWPGISFGTYKAKVVAIDKVISPNGKFRILASRNKQKWPISIQVGSGAKGIVLLKKVPVIYECWRKINGFPPEFYSEKNVKKDSYNGNEKK